MPEDVTWRPERDPEVQKSARSGSGGPRHQGKPHSRPVGRTAAMNDGDGRQPATGLQQPGKD